MEISVSYEILKSSLGDEADRADEFAEFLEDHWFADVAEVIDEGNEVYVDIEVLESGETRNRPRLVDPLPYHGESPDELLAMGERIEALLTPVDDLWEMFLKPLTAITNFVRGEDGMAHYEEYYCDGLEDLAELIADGVDLTYAQAQTLAGVKMLAPFCNGFPLGVGDDVDIDDIELPKVPK